MSSWHIEQTRKLVLGLYGRAQLELVSPCLRSVVDRQAYARFHYHETLDLLDRFVSTRLKDTSLLDVIFDGDDEIANDFQIFITKIGAHFTACIQSVHAVADNLGLALYYALALNLAPKPLALRTVSASSVLRELQGSAELAQVHVLFERLCTGGNFSHLAALVNHGKHRSVVQPSLNEDQTGLAPQRHTLKLPRFEYEGVSYPDISIKDFLEPEYDRCSVLVIDIGIALNATLRARAP